MAERFCARITIGGRLRQRSVRRFLEAVAESDVSLEWGDAPFRPRTGDDLRQALREGRLRLCDDQRSWGEFEELEAACRSLGLGYSRWTEGRYECDPELVEWRPGMRKPCARRGSNARSGATFVASDAVHKVAVHLAAGRSERALRALRRLCPEIAPLPPLEIVP